MLLQGTFELIGVARPTQNILSAQLSIGPLPVLRMFITSETSLLRNPTLAQLALLFRIVALQVVGLPRTMSIILTQAVPGLRIWLNPQAQSSYVTLAALLT